MSFHVYLRLTLTVLVHFTVATSNLPCNTTQAYCGWELMEQQNVPISTLGDVYAQQTGDDSLCSVTENGKLYCTCVFECGNGVWQCTQGEDGCSNDESSWVFEKGCKKYCHAGVCDG